jgi:DNA mismatch endonuclease (patch repair protein)
MKDVDPKRSYLMSRVKGKNTLPELSVRRFAHSLGLRFRLHRRDLPGTPDLVFPKWKLALFVHGCYWHRHIGCKLCTTPKTRVEFWNAKFTRNIERDRQNIAALKLRGWKVLVIWQCELRNPGAIKDRLLDATVRSASSVLLRD